MEKTKLRISLKLCKTSFAIACCLFLHQAGAEEFDQAFIDGLVRQAQTSMPAHEQIAGLQHPQQGDMPVGVDRLMYFVSFSIPDDGLKEMMLDAHYLQVPVLINGLINNDFRSTIKKIFDLKKDNNIGGVQIDPNAFKMYGIQKVPALVLQCGATYDVVYGNIKITNALEQIKDNGDCAASAERILKRIAK